MKHINCIILLIGILMSMPDYSHSGIIFEDDFGYYAGSGWSANCVGTVLNSPNGWTGYKCGSGNSLDIVDGAGTSGSPALKIGYVPDSMGAISLFKHLTDNISTGYDELYVRYQFKFDDDWKSGPDGLNFDYWKWIRLWQHIDPTDINQWSEINNVNTRYLVTNFAGHTGGHGCVTSVWSDNVSGNSASGLFYQVWYDYEDEASNRGCFKNFPGGELEIQQPGDANPGYFVTYPSSNQNWHTIEYHFKLSTTTAGNGVFEVWFDGVRQQIPTPYASAFHGGTMSYLNTMSYNGGMNFLTVFDNISGWNSDWGSTKRYIYIDDVIVSTSYIGPDSVPVGGYSQANIIPASQVSQATNGTGTVTINFKALDEFANNSITLSNFEYSTDSGSTWTGPTNGDSSAALSSNWADNSYFSGKYSVMNGTSAEWGAATAYSFTLNTKHADVAPLNQYEGDVKFRFYVNNGGLTSSNDPVQTESFSLDNMPPAKIEPAPGIN